MREYGDNILQLATMIVRDRGIAEDITQEVFIKAYKGLDSFRQESSAKTWLYRIAINESKKYLRSWSFRNIFSTLLPRNRPIAEPFDPKGADAVVLSNMSKADMAEQVMALSPQYRQVIVLHYYEDLSIKEVAQVLGVSEEVVRTKLHRARKQFKTLLEREGTEWS
ncbi:MAG: sigma-70 family RNA polymerase sigma factor [Clostridia bacterium]